MFYISPVVLPVAPGTTATAGTLQVMEPAIAGRVVKLKFTPTHYSEPHALSLHIYRSTSTSNINIQNIFHDTTRKNFIVSAVLQNTDNNNKICVKYNSNTCEPKLHLTLNGMFVYILHIVSVR